MNWNHVRTYWFEAGLGLILIALLVDALIRGSFTVYGTLLYASLLSYGACFSLTVFFLHRQGVRLFDRTMYGFASVASGVLLYEIVYHYGFGITIPLLIHDATFIGLISENGYFALDWSIISILIPFIGRRYMRMNKSLVALIVCGAALMAGWVAIGYPQFYAPQWWPAYNPIFNLIPINNGQPNNAAIEYWGLLFSSAAKIIAVIPAFLFNRKDSAILGSP